MGATATQLRIPGLPVARGRAASLAEVSVGQAVSGVFACTNKARLRGRNGTPYLVLDLRDETGGIEGRAFDRRSLEQRFECSDVLRASGSVRIFRGRERLYLTWLQRTRRDRVDPIAFLPRSDRDLDELDGFLEQLAREVRDPKLRRLVARVLGDGELRAELRRAPCGRIGHHAYLGGLLEHTVAVATLAYETCQVHMRLDCDLLLAAAILHDLGRTREFSYRGEFGLSQEGKRLGHLQLGVRMIEERARGIVGAERLDALLNCVLCHHGAGQGGLLPSPEAVALQRLNDLDAGVMSGLALTDGSGVWR